MILIGIHGGLNAKPERDPGLKEKEEGRVCHFEWLHHRKDFEKDRFLLGC